MENRPRKKENRSQISKKNFPLAFFDRSKPFYSVLKRPLAFFNRSKPFYSVLKRPFNYLTVLFNSKAFVRIFKCYNFDRFMTVLDRSYLLERYRKVLNGHRTLKNA